MRVIVSASILLVITTIACADERQNPGLKALVDASSDIAVVEVVNTNPRKAIEGARDTVELLVLRPIKGGLIAEKTIGVYYHLLWVDTDKWVLETPKFEKGRHYVIFLKASTLVDGEKRTVEYNLTDQWLSVQSVHPELERDAALAAKKSSRVGRGTRPTLAKPAIATNVGLVPRPTLPDSVIPPFACATGG
jgi:hypothetical protein